MNESKTETDLLVNSEANINKNIPPVSYVLLGENDAFKVQSGKSYFMDTVVSGVSDTQYTPFSSLHLLTAASIVIDREHLNDVSNGSIETDGLSEKRRGELLDQQSAFIKNVFSRIKIKVEPKKIRYYYEEEDISDEIDKTLSGEEISGLKHKIELPTWRNCLSGLVSNVLKIASSEHPILYIDLNLKSFGVDQMTPRILVSDDSNIKSHVNRMDKIIITSSKHDVSRGITDESSYFSLLRKKRSDFRSQIDRGEITFMERFDRKKWPHHPLIDHLKKYVGKVVSDIVAKNEFDGDPLDLTYQTLFRSTTYPIEAVFENGEKLEQYMTDMGAYKHWSNIMKLDPEIIAQFQINRNIVESIIDEQRAIINQRIKNTHLPVATILGRNGIFGEPDWKLLKSDGGIFAAKLQSGVLGKDVTDKKDVRFEPVDINLAKEFYRVFHYIHTPRGEMAFGLFLQDEKLPFSVVAFERIDREYKKDLMLMQGYDPRKCYDLARLYSRPGTPFNTSSTIFSSSFNLFKEKGYDVQAVLSAFMPSYAHGMSMISAGFNDGVLIKNGGHVFGKKEIYDKIVYEHLTKRRDNEATDTISSEWPLLPVMELMAQIQKPRFEPFKEASRGMLVVNR